MSILDTDTKRLGIKEILSKKWQSGNTHLQCFASRSGKPMKLVALLTNYSYNSYCPNDSIELP